LTRFFFLFLFFFFAVVIIFRLGLTVGRLFGFFLFFFLTAVGRFDGRLFEVFFLVCPFPLLFFLQSSKHSKYEVIFLLLLPHSDCICLKTNDPVFDSSKSWKQP